MKNCLTTPCLQFITLFFLVFAANNLSAQNDSTTEEQTNIALDMLRFQSAFEKDVFQQFSTQSHKDDLMFFIAADSTKSLEDYKSVAAKLDSFANEVLMSGIMKKSHKKQLKKIYQAVHGNYLDKYSYQNNFSSIFENGEYNCVSGTALYSSIFNKLNIPYSIQELPTHVLLVAYPAEEEIAVETTDPNAGYLVISEKMKKEYAEHLRENKLISESEYQEGYDVVFEKNYFNNRIINLSQLAGIQYSNNAIYAFEKEAYLTSRNNAAKAYFIYQSDEILNTLLAATSTCIEYELGKPEDEILNYNLASKFVGHGIDSNFVLLYFEQKGATIAQNNNDTNTYRQLYQIVYQNVNDSTFRNSLSLIYHYQLARYFTLQSNTDMQIQHALQAYNLDSTNLEVESIVVASLDGIVKYNTLQKSISMIDSICENYPALQYNKALTTWRCNAYLEYAGNNFRDKNPTEAEKYYSKFKSMVGDQSLYKIGAQSRNFEYAINEGAVYYFRRGAYSKVDRLIESATKIDPNNGFIKALKARYR